jgi:hypothetical protein
MPSKLSCSLVLSFLACGGAFCCRGQDAIVPAGVPLRIQVDRRYPIDTGTKVEGHLIAPVYLVDREVLPVNTKVSGSVIASRPVRGKERADALLNGDFTPLRKPELRFDAITLPDGKTLPIATQVTQRDGTVVKMKAGKKSLKQQTEEAVKQQEQEALDQVRQPGKTDRLLRILFSQLPYHPQRIWPGTQFDADLTAPLRIPQKAPYTPLPVQPPGKKPLTGLIEARLTQDLSSATARQGQPIDAVLTRPLLDSTKKQVLLPEGTHLEGVVLQARPARRFARNGKLRFTFRRVELPQTAAAPVPKPGPRLESPKSGTASAGTDQLVHGRMISSETDRRQNVQIDSEGGAKATGGPDKYVAPLVLGLLAASVAEGDNDNVVKNGVTGNGFGLMARVAGMAAANKQVSMGFACYALAKSVYKRWIARGSELTFPKDTRIQIELSER